MYYYRITAFVLQGGNVGVTHGKALCVHLVSSQPIEESLEMIQKVSNLILEEIRKQEEFLLAHNVRIEQQKEVSDKKFSAGKIKITVIF